MRIYYDEEGDFLEIGIGKPHKTEYTDEIKKDIFITRDEKTDEIKSIGILNFKKRSKNLKELNIPVNISIEA